MFLAKMNCNHQLLNLSCLASSFTDYVQSVAMYQYGKCAPIPCEQYKNDISIRQLKWSCEGKRPKPSQYGQSADHLLVLMELIGPW